MNKVLVVLRLDESLNSLLYSYTWYTLSQVTFQNLSCILQELLTCLEHVFFLKSKACLSWIKGTNLVASAEICSWGLMFPVVYTECSAGIIYHLPFARAVDFL